MAVRALQRTETLGWQVQEQDTDKSRLIMKLKEAMTSLLEVSSFWGSVSGH